MKNIRNIRTGPVSFRSSSETVRPFASRDIEADEFLFAECVSATTIHDFDICATIIERRWTADKEVSFPITLNTDQSLAKAIVEHNESPRIYKFLHMFKTSFEPLAPNCVLVFDAQDWTYYVFSTTRIDAGDSVRPRFLDASYCTDRLSALKRIENVSAACDQLSESAKSLKASSESDSSQSKFETMIQSMRKDQEEVKCKWDETISALEKKTTDKRLRNELFGRLNQHDRINVGILLHMRTFKPESPRTFVIDQRLYEHFIAILSQKVQPDVDAEWIRVETDSILEKTASNLQKTFSLDEIKSIIDKL